MYSLEGVRRRGEGEKVSGIWVVSCSVRVWKILWHVEGFIIDCVLSFIRFG